MPKVSISQAAKMANISRSTLYNKYINPGLISVETVENNKLIDVSELIRVFGSSLKQDNNDTANSTMYDNSTQPENTVKDKVISLLEQQIQEAKAREKESQEREAWLKTQIDELRQQQNNLLENKIPKKRKKVFGIF